MVINSTTGWPGVMFCRPLVYFADLFILRSTFPKLWVDLRKVWEIEKSWLNFENLRLGLGLLTEIYIES